MKTVREVAEIFSVCEMTVRRWIYSGKLKAVKVGRTVRIQESEIEKIKRGE